MPKKKHEAIIISISSDIGSAMAFRWLSAGWKVRGTYRNVSPCVKALKGAGAGIVKCDLSRMSDITAACTKLESIGGNWDVLVLGAGTQEPIGPFKSGSFHRWAESVHINFIHQLAVVRYLLASRKKRITPPPCVLFFAGGGTNNATLNYSAYTISKIALIKMCELLDAEIPDVRFTIVGPGWVRTKIHQETLRAGKRAGNNLTRAKEKLASNDFTPMQDVLDCCDWIIDSPREIVSGRNFSVVFDAWGDRRLHLMLRDDKNMYKLRRYGNDFRLKTKEKR